MKRALAALLIAMILIPCRSVLADFYHYGVAADEFLDDNDRYWSSLSRYPEWSSSRNLLRDNLDANDLDRSSGDSVYDDLVWYSNNLQSGDVLMFTYSGHGGWTMNDLYTPDEGSTSRPIANDPDPDNDGPYAGEEFFGWTGSTQYLRDDHLTDIFAGFDPGVTVVVISGACHGGGWVGGSHDLNASAPATNNGLYAILGAPEQGYGIGVGPFPVYYEILLTTALAETLDSHMTMSAWYEAAMLYGENATYNIQFTWDSSPQPYYFWPDDDWVPSSYENTYFSGTDHWGWQETYLQLRPEAYSYLDAEHDFTIGTPEPTTTVLVALGVAAIAYRRRRV